MFNLNAPEIAVLVLFAVILLAPHVPGLPGRARSDFHPRGRWSWRDWFIVGLAIVAGAIIVVRVIEGVPH